MARELLLWRDYSIFEDLSPGVRIRLAVASGAGLTSASNRHCLRSGTRLNPAVERHTAT